MGMNPQVLVIGAGPVGLTLAMELARYGVRVRIVDKNAGRTDKSKALAVWSRTLELLERAGCAGSFVAAGLPGRGANMYSGDRRIAHIALDQIHSAYNFALMLPQSESERLLEQHLASLGVRVERQVEATAFKDDGDGVDVTLRHADGGTEALRVDWLAGCDGAHSLARHGLGLQFEGDTLQSDWMLADVHVKGLPSPADEVAVWLHHEGLCAVFPITPGRYRVIADGGASQGERAADPTLEQMQALFDRRGPGGVTLGEPIWLSGFRINERKVREYRAGRVFLAGDAAHVHSPAGGQGMNTGMQDAINLAWKLALVCRGTLPAEPLLASYSPERSAVGDKVLADAGRLTQAATLRNPLAVAARNLVASLALGLPPLREAMVQNFSEITIGYPASPLNGPHLGHGPAPGQRIAPVPGQPPIGAGREPRFALLAEPGEELQAVLLEYAGLLEPQLRPPPQAGGIWLVRPDGYVACAAREPAKIGAYLEHLKRGG
jgi:2-polyprenyl-6-methoxyphenol hydroxylase-like FAD-dependent oxidoreductase